MEPKEAKPGKQATILSIAEEATISAIRLMPSCLVHLIA
jgi:hypothetical protein